MRLSDTIVKKIKKSIKESFGDVDSYLFGSRVDDAKVGGDIDIAIDSKSSRIEFRKKKVQFIISMMKSNLDLKIDVVKFHNNDKFLSEQIKKNAILL